MESDSNAKHWNYSKKKRAIKYSWFHTKIKVPLYLESANININKYKVKLQAKSGGFFFNIKIILSKGKWEKQEEY